jgi:hypothetical protein
MFSLTLTTVFAFVSSFDSIKEDYLGFFCWTLLRISSNEMKDFLSAKFGHSSFKAFMTNSKTLPLTSVYLTDFISFYSPDEPSNFSLAAITLIRTVDSSSSFERPI